MRLILIRHGQTQSNVDHLLDTGFPGAPLTELGLEQAAALAETLAGDEIEAVYTSDLIRARQTGRPLADALDVPLSTHPGLREIFAGVDDMAVDWMPYVSVLDSWHETPNAKLPGGESAVEFMTRFDSAVREIVETGLQTVALVSHGAALRVWIPATAKNIPVGAARHWRLNNTDTVVMDHADDGWRLVRWADDVFAD